jgi:hypothetical protein
MWSGGHNRTRPSPPSLSPILAALPQGIRIFMPTPAGFVNYGAHVSVCLIGRASSAFRTAEHRLVQTQRTNFHSRVKLPSQSCDRTAHQSYTLPCESLNGVVRWPPQLPAVFGADVIVILNGHSDPHCRISLGHWCHPELLQQLAAMLMPM